MKTKQSDRIWAVSHGINWNWFACLSIEGGQVTILGEARLHRGDDWEMNRQLSAWAGDNAYRVLEEEVSFGETRIAIGVEVNGERLPLANGKQPRWERPGLVECIEEGP